MAPICPDLMMLFTASGRTPAARATSRTLKTSGTDVLAVDIDSVGCGAISLPDWFCAGERAPVCFSAVIAVCCCGNAARAVLNQRQPAKTGTPPHVRVPGCQGARGARVPGCQGARGARVPGCQGATCPCATCPRATCYVRLSRATYHTCQVPGCHVPGAMRGVTVTCYVLRTTCDLLACHVLPPGRTSQHVVEPRRTRTLQNLVEPRRTQQNLFLTLFEVC
jgi:hypothetical protein